MCGLGWMTTTMDRRLRGASIEASMSDSAADGTPHFRIGEDIVTETVCASVDHQPDAHVEASILTADDDPWVWHLQPVFRKGRNAGSLDARQVGACEWSSRSGIDNPAGRRPT